jgi:transcription antitermination protein NusB
MKARHQAREVAFQILYRYDQLPEHPPGELSAEIRDHFEHFHVSDELREFAALLAAGTLTHAPELDTLLEQHASNWKISRMNVIDRNLLRMAIFELIHVPETPPSVVIDEAIELAKQFGTAESPAFINGVLDAVKNSLQKPEGALEPG